MECGLSNEVVFCIPLNPTYGDCSVKHKNGRALAKVSRMLWSVIEPQGFCEGIVSLGFAMFNCQGESSGMWNVV